MGNPPFPATLLAVWLALAAPEISFAQDDLPDEDRRRTTPLPRVEVRDRHAGPDQERLGPDDLSRSRGTGNADVFSALNGVMMNNLRNEAGAIDIGIRGLQGEGRVPIVIDGALQSTHTHRGYQGESDRTYIDMDLIRDVTLTKGASFGGDATGGIGGVVRMRTLEVDDVLLPGQTFGILVKRSQYNNDRSPNVAATARGQQYYLLSNGQSEGRFDNGASTLALAGKHDAIDWLLAHSQRRDGNYFAGRHGIARYEAPVVSAGQEVVNTSYESQSSLLKFGFRTREAQRLEFVWRHHEQQAGEVLAAYWHKNGMDGRIPNTRLVPWPHGVESMPQWSPGSTRLNSYSLDYAYAPPANKLIGVNMGVWKTDVTMHQLNGLWSGAPGSEFADLYRHRFADARQGFNLSNRALMRDGLFGLEVGLNAEEQRTEPLDFVRYYARSMPSARDARRSAYSTWINGEINSALAVIKIGARLHGASVSDNIAQRRTAYRARTDVLGELLVPLAGGVELYGKGGRSYRHPSLFESSMSQQVFSYDYVNPIRPEQSDNWALGLQGKWKGLLLPKSTLTAGGGYFSNNVKNYISAANLASPEQRQAWDFNFTFANYDRLALSGWEMKIGLDLPAFFAEASGTLYDRPRVCSRQLARTQEPPAPDCNDVGFDWSLIPTRIAPRSSYNLKAGVRLFEARLVLGGRLNYHSSKHNPGGWLGGTGATPVIEVPSERIVDLFASLRVGRHADMALSVDNLMNRYAYDPGTVIGKPRPGRTVRLTLSGRF